MYWQVGGGGWNLPNFIHLESLRNPQLGTPPLPAFPLMALCSETIISQSIVESRMAPWSLCF